jgi:hypothetical protein
LLDVFIAFIDRLRERAVFGVQSLNGQHETLENEFKDLIEHLEEFNENIRNEYENLPELSKSEITLLHQRTARVKRRNNIEKNVSS